LCAAEFFDRTHGAVRLTGETNNCAEIDKRRIVHPSIGFWNQTPCVLPQFFLTRTGIEGTSEIEKPCQNPSRVGFYDWDGLIEGEAGHCVRGIFPDAWQPSHLID